MRTANSAATRRRATGSRLFSKGAFRARCCLSRARPGVLLAVLVLACLRACLFACLPVCVPLRSPHTRRAWVCDATGVGSDTLRLRRRMSRHGVEAARPLVDEAPVTHASRAFRPAQRPRAHAPCFISHACTPLQPGPGPARRRQMTAPAKDSRR